MMDPATAAGLGLQVASICFQLFAGCLEGFVMLSTAQNIGKDGSTLICMLNIQEVQFTEWARKAGLLAGDFGLDSRLNEAIIESTLRKLKELMLDTEKLKKRYHLEFEEDLPQQQNRPGQANNSRALAESIMSHTISEEMRKNVLFLARVTKSRNSLPRRIRWAAVGKESLETLVGDIRSLVRGLWHMLDPLRQDDLASGINTLLSHVIDVSTKIDDLVSLKEALNKVPSPHSNASSSQQTHETLASIAGIKALKTELESVEDGRSIGTADSGDVSEGELVSEGKVGESTAPETLDKSHIEDFTPVKGLRDIGTATYDGRPVLVEWKDMPLRNRNKILVRVESLASLLRAHKHASFRTLTCRGLARDNDASRIGFLYSIEPGYTMSKPPRSLRGIFGDSNPSVTERIDLALKIIKTIQCFHTAGWLHKNLRSEHIIFFPGGNHEADKSGTNLLANPILAGFAFSRFDSPVEISEQPSADPQRDIYRHPDAMGEPAESFDKQKDLYALGTMLLEIGEWRSLKSIVANVVNLNDGFVGCNELRKIRPFLLDKGSKGGLKTLRYRMGDVYENVTRMLLEGDLSPEVKSNEASIHGFVPSILDLSIRQLERCHI